jgi:L-alanine-DL-glutamate epimerase-like enolase superfamily enzyme
MPKLSDMRLTGAAVRFIPVHTRVPLKFGPEILTSVQCARVEVTAVDGRDRQATGVGECPLSAQWAWPSATTSLADRTHAMCEFCTELADLWGSMRSTGHALEIGHEFLRTVLPGWVRGFNQRRRGAEPMPWLAALICCAPFDLATHDAYGLLQELPVYSTYGPHFLNRDLAAYLQPADASGPSFQGRYPADFLEPAPAATLPVWHLVGGVDPLTPGDLSGQEPHDGYPVLLRDWIRRDGLRCLKVKLRGNDLSADYSRFVAVGQMGVEEEVLWLSADFNCTVSDPAYVVEFLERLCVEHPRLYGMLLYVEQPFPYDLPQHAIRVHAISSLKPLFLDESAHDWEMIRLGRHLGWNGVALKTCKTQTGALLSHCWARAHGMSIMVQDLTNPMLAQVPHVLLAAYARTLMGVESNAMQFYPDASRREAAVHPGLYERRAGVLRLDSIRGPGFGYRLAEMPG